MTSTFRAPGDTVNFVAEADHNSGDGIVLGDLFGVVLADVITGDLGGASVTGVHELPVLGTDNVTIGQRLYWNAGNEALTLTEAGNLAIGKAAGSSGAGVTTVEALLLPGLA